jgi:CheY-like chemotaxis protein/anti-sigma regulatory factor (Ser/Thr protein kinase)
MPSAYTVLVVDDSPTQQLQIRLVLEGCGFHVVCADNGADALKLVDAAIPDIVVTDLQMPEMNGLELVAEIKKRFQALPVILTTAVGSESIATEALQIGATSYVPKRELTEYLCETVTQVLEVVKAESGTASTASTITRTELHFEIGNCEAMVPGIIARMEQALVEMGFCDEMHWMQIAMALDEAIVNAIFHGNLEVSTELRQTDDGKPFVELVEKRKTLTPFRSRRVQISLSATPEVATFVVRDSGHGFNVAELPDPTDPANLERAGGRGLLLIHSFMDEVRHNDLGNEITMVKRKPAPITDDCDEE